MAEIVAAALGHFKTNEGIRPTALATLTDTPRGRSGEIYWDPAAHLLNATHSRSKR
jgi:hypothetical protein